MTNNFTMNGTKKVLIIYIFLWLPLFTIALVGQEIVEVEDVKGIGVISGRSSEVDARRDAIDRAKIEALRKAGVSEHIQSYELLFTSERDHNYSQFFSSEIQSELRGAVLDYDITDEQRMINPHSNNFEIAVTLNARIIKYSKLPDPAFDVRVSGIKAVYNEGEFLEFEVISTLDAYLNIFNITDDEAYLMYPNPWEKQQIIPAGRRISFPFRADNTQAVDYVLEKPSDEPQTNRLIFVFTKTPITFLHYRGEEQLTTTGDMFSWIYSISPDMRKTDYHVLIIR